MRLTGGEIPLCPKGPLSLTLIINENEIESHRRQVWQSIGIEIIREIKIYKIIRR